MQAPATDANAAQAVRDRVALAMRRARTRDASRRLWRTAPYVSAAGVAAALLAFQLGWPSAAPLGVLAAGVLGLVAWFLVARRTGPVTDIWAARLDADARLDGELRSAAWFARSEPRDPWADLHVARAARRLETLDWHAIYPTVAPGRPAIIALTLAIATVGLAIALPAGSSAPARPGSPAPRDERSYAQGRVVSATDLPPELLEQLARLLAAAEAGDQAAVEALSSRSDLVSLLEQLSRQPDRALLDALARAMAGEARADAAEALASRARQAAESAAMSAAMRNALEQLADDIEVVGPDGSQAQGDSTGPGAMPSEGAGGEAAGMPGEQVSIQFARDTQASGGTGVMLLAEQDATGEGGAPGAGFGGAQTPDAPGAAAELDAALRREVVEAHEDAPGASDRKEIQRKTGETRATTAFTRTAAGEFDDAAAAAPPPVPETRRPGVRSYFVRPPR